jgi:DNA-binding CsgD family transcriptional regulator
MEDSLKLSKRQNQLIDCLARGCNNLSISKELNISEHTVKVHMWRLFKKLEVNSRTHALVKVQAIQKEKIDSSFTRDITFRMYACLRDIQKNKKVDLILLDQIINDYKKCYISTNFVDIESLTVQLR